MHRDDYEENLNPAPGDLKANLLSELRSYLRREEDDERLYRLCKEAPGKIVQEWRLREIDPKDSEAVLRFYVETDLYCFELIGMEIDTPPERRKQLRDFADLLVSHGKTRGCDYGSGIGTLGIYLNKSGIPCDFADVSETNLGFIRERLKKRKLAQPRLIHLLKEKLPENQYDFITAFDVLEHAADPLSMIGEISSKLRPEGLFIFNLLYDNEVNTPHLLLDPNPIRKKLRSFGLKKIGSLGEFKVYRKVARSRISNQFLLFADSAFWASREFARQIRPRLRSSSATGAKPRR